MTKVRIIIGLLLVFFISSFVFIVADALGATTINVPLNTIVRGNEGDIKPVRDPVSVADLNAQPGDICDVSALTGNPASEHSFNDLIVGSNGDEVTASNVEEFAGKTTQATGTLTLGSTVTFDVLLGPDEVFSGGMDVEFKCSSTPPPNDVPDWCEAGIKFDDLPGLLTFTVPEPPPGTTWTLLVLKAGLDNFEISNPVVGQAYSHPNGKEISHAIICFEEEVPTSTTTTTTTEPPGSTTTSTTTPRETTTTTSTTTTIPNSTTTTTVPPSSTTTLPTTTSTTEVSPPTLIESGDAGYIGEADDGHEHENAGFDWLLFGAILFAGFSGASLGYLATKRYLES